MNTNEIMQKALKTMSNKEKAAIWPPLEERTLLSVKAGSAATNRSLSSTIKIKQ